MPITDAIGMQTPRMPDTSPRWATGTWSGSTATMAASRALKNSWAMHHPTSTTAMVGASATTRMPSEPPIRPMTIHGRRMPSRDEVRSLIRPKNGLPNSDTRAPTPVTSDRLFGARSVPTSELTFSARLTSAGARNTRQVLMYASAYRAMKPQPTRRTAAVRRSIVRPRGQPAAGRRPGRRHPPSGTVAHGGLLTEVSGHPTDTGSLAGSVGAGGSVEPTPRPQMPGERALLERVCEG